MLLTSAPRCSALRLARPRVAAPRAPAALLRSWAPEPDEDVVVLGEDGFFWTSRQGEEEDAVQGDAVLSEDLDAVVRRNLEAALEGMRSSSSAQRAASAEAQFALIEAETQVSSNWLGRVRLAVEGGHGTYTLPRKMSPILGSVAGVARPGHNHGFERHPTVPYPCHTHRSPEPSACSPP